MWAASQSSQCDHFYPIARLIHVGSQKGSAQHAADLCPSAAQELTLSCTPALLRALPMRRLATAVVVFWRTLGGCSSPGLKALDFAHACSNFVWCCMFGKTCHATAWLCQSNTGLHDDQTQGLYTAYKDFP